MKDTLDGCQDTLGAVEDEVYVEHPLGFETHDRETHVCKLKKALYDLK